MGFFSWLTADTNESISNTYAEMPNSGRTVYLLQPGGDNIESFGYEGYGEFGGVDAYEWLANQHGYDDRSDGIALSYGSYYEHKDGSRWVYGIYDIEGLTQFPGTYAAIIPKYGLTPNEMINNGDFTEGSLSDLMGGLKYPLKFSFDKDAVYEDLTASKDCPNQGYFDD